MGDANLRVGAPGSEFSPEELASWQSKQAAFFESTQERRVCFDAVQACSFCVRSISLAFLFSRDFVFPFIFPAPFAHLHFFSLRPL
jgi:hypothetical protein